MFERITNGWALSKASWAVLKLDKELLVFPLLSGIACLLELSAKSITMRSLLARCSRVPLPTICT